LLTGVDTEVKNLDSDQDFPKIGTFPCPKFDIFERSVLGVDRRSRISEQKITSGRSPLYLITSITLLM